MNPSKVNVVVSLFVAVLALLAQTTQAWSQSRVPSFSRRAFLEKGTAGAVGLVLADVLKEPANAASVKQETEQESEGAARSSKEAAVRKKAQEKEAARIAKDTKQRLAAGRIGRI